MSRRGFQSMTLLLMRTSAIATCLTMLSAASTPVSAEQTDYWIGSFERVFSDTPPPPPHARRPKPAVDHSLDSKAEKLASEGRKPQGPLVIAISIQRQRVRIYDAKGLFAESPISSGMAGHSTPMGVFSVIQKHKYHHSNIYSGAPMPYMQRITWSGVAMHAGVLPGYPASHGCIRMPMSFAMKMWAWTKMGARVVVTPGEVSPVDFAHPVLAALEPPVPVASAPSAANIKTADASGSIGLGLPKVMADAASSTIATTRAPEVTADAASVTTIGAAVAEIEAPAVISVSAPEPSIASADISDGGPLTTFEIEPEAIAGPAAQANADLAETTKSVSQDVAESATASIPVVETSPIQPHG